MTSNQIAFAQTQEAIRHNQAYEVETNRHNVESEDIQKEANRIEEKKVDNDKWYQEQMAAIEREYKTALIKLQRSQGDEKNRLQAELNDIEARRAGTTAEYQRNQNEIAKEQNVINSRAQDEINRHNTAMEGIESQYKTTMAELAAREVVYKETQSREQISFWQAQQNIDMINAYTRRSEMFSLNALRTLQGQALQQKLPYEIGSLQQQINVDNARWKWMGFDVLSKWVPFKFSVGGK